jgi:lipoic acid synthetase
MLEKHLPKPAWIKVNAASANSFPLVEQALARHGLETVCTEALCPNRAECWGAGTAAFIIMGNVCTRACRFCAVSTGRAGLPLDPDEGPRLAQAVKELNLSYVTITSVDRDDLPDAGAAHFAACVAAVKGAAPGVRVEALIPDYGADGLAAFARAPPAVFAHNVETVRELQGCRDRRASFDKSLATLAAAKASPCTTKSSIMLGLGETAAQVLETMDALRGVGVDILVMGQYLRPTKRQIPVTEYVTPRQFAWFGERAREKGFRSVVSAPFARTSYHAAALL